MFKKQHHATGYGILADDHSDVEAILNPSTSSGASQSSMLLSNEHRGYGSLRGGSTSSPDSSFYNRWYIEGYDDVGRIGSIQYEEHTQAYPYDTEDGLGAEAYSCEESDCIDKEGAVVLSTEQLVNSHHQVNGYPSGTDMSGGEQTYYSPFYERKTTGVASTTLVAWNILNLLLSTSLLAFPYAVATGGLVVLPFIVLICIMTNYTSRILINMMYESSNTYHGKKVRVRIDYADLSQDAFNSYRGAWFIHTVQVFEMLGICVLNICALGSLCHEILPKVNIQICSLIVALLALPTFFIRKLAVIGWMQTIGVFSLTLGLILVQGFCLSHASKWTIVPIPVWDPHKLPIAIGIIIYAFGKQGVMPGLEEQMRKPKRFGFVINLTFIMSACIQIVFSLTNAMYYGTNINQVVTVDLESHLSLGIATACFIGISILLQFSLPTFVVLEKLDNALHNVFPCCPSSRNSRCNQVLSVFLRIGIITFSLGLAVLLPYFAYVMAFIGSAIIVFTSLIIPCWFHLKLRRFYLSWYQIGIDMFIILFGFACFSFGSYFSFCEIYDDYMGLL